MQDCDGIWQSFGIACVTAEQCTAKENTARHMNVLVYPQFFSSGGYLL